MARRAAGTSANSKRGPVHVQLRQDLRVHVLLVGHAGRLRHDAAQQAERVVGIFVARAGRRGERNALGEPVVQHGVGGAQLLIAPRVVFGKARAVAEQLANGQRRRVARGPLHPRELRDPSRHRVFERQPAIVAQLQHRQRGEALGHRRDAERGVRRDRRLRGAVADARTIPGAPPGRRSPRPRSSRGSSCRWHRRGRCGRSPASPTAVWPRGRGR